MTLRNPIRLIAVPVALEQRRRRPHIPIHLSGSHRSARRRRIHPRDRPRQIPRQTTRIRFLADITQRPLSPIIHRYAERHPVLIPTHILLLEEPGMIIPESSSVVLRLRRMMRDMLIHHRPVQSGCETGGQHGVCPGDECVTESESEGR